MTAGLNPAQRDRAAGVLVGQACGDALGVPYEFATPPAIGTARMQGGGLGPYAPGQWSDDTEMAICIARVASGGDSLSTTAADEALADLFQWWLHEGARDVGTHTRALLTEAGALPGSPGAQLRRASEQRHVRTRHTAGNGALMRTAIVGLTRLLDRDATAAAARSVASLTHADPLAGDSSVLWAEAVRVAVLDGKLDLESGVELLPIDRRAYWADSIAAVQVGGLPLTPNGFTVTALQAAWAACLAAEQLGHSSTNYAFGVHTAVATGDDTDTVAAIAGGLLGARYGLRAIPPSWINDVHGWPGLRAPDLIDLALNTATNGLG